MSLEAHVPLIQSEADTLAHYLSSRSPDDLRQPSPCEGWEIRDVVGHLIFLADYYIDRLTRGLRGDISIPADCPGGDAPDFSRIEPFFERYLAQQAHVWRERFGAQLLPTLRIRYAALTDMLSDLSPQEWETPCASWRHQGTVIPRSVRTFFVIIIQELAIHGWDIRSPLDPDVTLSAGSTSLLMEEHIPGRFGRQHYTDFPLPTGVSMPVRYRFKIQGDQPSQYDIIIERDKPRMDTASVAPADVTFYCDAATFTLLMYKRIQLDSVVNGGRIAVEGNQALITAFDQWLAR